jgi:cysteine desulfurase
MKRVYLDHAATTPVDRRVLKSMSPYFDREFGNASSLYHHGQQANLVMENSRRKIAKLINAEAEEIIFTSGGTESDNMALVGVAMANRDKGNHVITTKIEHHAVLETCRYLEKIGFSVTYLDVDRDGLVNPGEVEKAIGEKTILVSVMFVNNEIGTIQPISEIGRICRKKGVCFHTDAVQGFMKLPIDVKSMNTDLLSASAHKIYGPKGVGLLYVRKGIGMEPLIHGGNHEGGRRAGTENVAGIVGFARACEIASESMKEESKRLTGLRDGLVKAVLKIPGSYLNGHPEKRLPGNANFRFEGIEGEALILRLDALGIEASTGSACSSHELKPSHVLTSIGLRQEQAHGSLRITLGRHTTKQEIDYVVGKLPKVVEDLRRISPFGKLQRK